jgi:hypothetical protein
MESADVPSSDARSDEESRNNEQLLTQDQKDIIAEAANSACFKDNPVPEDVIAELKDDLFSFVSISPRMSESLEGIFPAHTDAEALLQAIWSEARSAGALRLFKDVKVNFPLPYHMKKSGDVAEVSIAKNNKNVGDNPSEKPWLVVYVPFPSSVARQADESVEVPSPAVTAPLTNDLPLRLSNSMSEMGKSRDYKKGRVSDELLGELKSHDAPLSSFTFISSEIKDRIIKAAGKSFDVTALLDRDFSAALELHALREHDGKVIFPISIRRADGRTLVEVVIKRTETHGDVFATGVKSWRVQNINDTVRKFSPAGGAFERWATFGSWNVLLKELADVALKETWDFSKEGGDTGRYPILKNYLIYTFYKLQHDNKLKEDPDSGFAAFDTGLVDKLYEPIYACFISSGREEPKWKFEGFCRAGSQALGKRLVRTFNPYPERAKYFSRKEDLLYDVDQDLELDVDHILIDNMDRLPFDFLRDELDSDREAHALLDALERTHGRDSRAELFCKLGELVDNNTKLHLRLKNRLDDATDLALKRVEWNFRTAVPAFFPTRNTMSLLLPLDLTEDDNSDIALVVEPTSSGNYLGQTILTMQMAYKDARLVCRPDSDWLNTSVSTAETEESEDEGGE